MPVPVTPEEIDAALADPGPWLADCSPEEAARLRAALDVLRGLRQVTIAAPSPAGTLSDDQHLADLTAYTQEALRLAAERIVDAPPTSGRRRVKRD